MDSDKTELLRHRNTFERKAKKLLFKGVLWYKAKHNLTWDEIGLKLQENGHTYNPAKFRAVGSNWAANSIVYYFNIYNTFDIPTPTPELLLYWDTEIKRMELERAEARRLKREKVQAGKLREAERIAAGGTPRKHNDRRK